METTRKTVLVASGSSPDRAIALERLLVLAAGRSGWLDRLEIRLGGVEGGAGHLSDAGRSALGVAGIEAKGTLCPDLARRPELLEGADVVVCDRGDVADVLVDWKETGEAEFVCVDEIHGVPRDEEERDDTAIAEEIRGYEEVIDEVLRRVITGGFAE